MAKRRISKKRVTCIEDAPIVKPKVRATRYDPLEKFEDVDFVAIAFFEALADNEVELAIQIIRLYVQATARREISEKEKMPLSTIYNALSKKANPTLRTISKLLH